MKKLLPVLCFALIAACDLVLTGCETESVANSDLTISPVSIALQKDEYVDLTASGGYDYTWSLSDSTKGILSETTGSSVRYTDRYDPGSNGTVFVQTITVKSTINSANSTSASTSNSSYAATASAQVEHLSTPEEEAFSDLSISPTSASLTNTQSASFTVSGGNGDYTWSLQNPAFGTLSSTTGDSTTYTDGYDPGLSNTVYQVIYVSDTDGRETSATIDHTH